MGLRPAEAPVAAKSLSALRRLRLLRPEEVDGGIRAILEQAQGSAEKKGMLRSAVAGWCNPAMDKVAALKEILQLDPANAFARYGLAMEYVGRGETETALVEFGACIEHNPDYVPAYQMSAQTLAKAGRVSEALERLHAGIGAANRTGNQHALAEMEGMREELR